MTRAALFSEPEIDREIELLGLKNETAESSFAYRLKRCIIRVLRFIFGSIGLGMAYGLCAYAFEMPFSSLSISMLLLAFASASAAIFVFIISLVVAFGPPPTAEQKHEDLRQKALASLTIKHPVGLSIKTVDYSVDCTGYQINTK